MGWYGTSGPGHTHPCLQMGFLVFPGLYSLANPACDKNAPPISSNCQVAYLCLSFFSLIIFGRSLSNLLMLLKEGASFCFSSARVFIFHCVPLTSVLIIIYLFSTFNDYFSSLEVKFVVFKPTRPYPTMRCVTAVVPSPPIVSLINLNVFILWPLWLLYYFQFLGSKFLCVPRLPSLSHRDELPHKACLSLCFIFPTLTSLLVEAVWFWGNSCVLDYENTSIAWFLICLSGQEVSGCWFLCLQFVFHPSCLTVDPRPTWGGGPGFALFCFVFASIWKLSTLVFILLVDTLSLIHTHTHTHNTLTLRYTHPCLKLDPWTKIKTKIVCVDCPCMKDKAVVTLLFLVMYQSPTPFCR